MILRKFKKQKKGLRKDLRIMLNKMRNWEIHFEIVRQNQNTFDEYVFCVRLNSKNQLSKLQEVCETVIINKRKQLSKKIQV